MATRKGGYGRFDYRPPEPAGREKEQSVQKQLPECPFRGVVIAVDEKIYTPFKGEPRTYVTLAIMRDDEMGEPSNDVYFHHFPAASSLEPKTILRKGHRVKVKQVEPYESYMRAVLIEFDPAQLAEAYLKEAARS